MTKWIKRLVASMSFSMAMVGVIVFPISMNFTGFTPNEPIEPQPTQVIKTQWEIALENWIEKLVYYESNGITDVVVLDWNNKYSYGCLQFQEETFRGFVDGFNLLPNATYEEVMNFIYDCDFQKQLAFKMIDKRYENWRHWYYSIVVAWCLSYH